MSTIRLYNDLCRVGSVWAIPLCDPDKPVAQCETGLGVVVARPTPFSVRSGKVLMFGFSNPHRATLESLEPDWFHQPPSAISMVFTHGIWESAWEHIGVIDVSDIVIPGFKTCDDYGRWRHVIYDPARVSMSGRQHIINDVEAERRGSSSYLGIREFQDALFIAVKLGWKWAPPKEVYIKGYQVIRHLL